jgi:CheY-like chemotaxis protein
MVEEESKMDMRSTTGKISGESLDLTVTVARPSETVHLLTLVSDDAQAQTQAGERAGRAEPTLRVLLVDDHEAVRRGLRSAVWGAGWQVCGEATNGSEAIAKVKELTPDVVILDVSMPVMGGLDAAPEILKSAPATKVVAFTMHESQQIRNELARIGVHGLAIKSAPLSNLLDTIKSVLSKDKKEA